jgi:CheY-like chemotaxis protein/anti-sigma regulatory factor (Ser/Thr protein kinase)
VDVSRVVSGRFRLDVRSVDLVPVIRAAAEFHTPASEAKEIRLHLQLDEQSAVMSGDPERLQQVMSNLISNAIKFTPKGGEVEVVLRWRENDIEVEVRDNGIGIEPAFLPHVFEPFRQGTGGTMRRHGGLGLGLSIVRHIVELHGGEITAHSGGPDQGSKFTLTFPQPPARVGGAPLRGHSGAAHALEPIPLGQLNGMRVLIVDDEPTSSEALGVLFSSCGATARVVNSAAEALAVLDSWLPEVLISDIAMPGEDGYSLIRKLRSRAPERGGLTPALALTAFANVADRATIQAAGYQMHLSKPADPNELIAAVGRLANRRGHAVDGAAG